MELKKEFESLLKWGLESPEHKKQATNMAAYLINALNSIDKKELTKEELKKIAGGILNAPAAY